MDTFSVNSLKLLQNSYEDFEKKYILNLEIIPPKTKEIITGDKFHSLICSYLKGYDLEKALAEEEIEIWEKTKNSEIIQFAKNSKVKFIEQPFFVKLNSYYLTGRFDVVIKNEDKFIILDWKTKNLPKNPKKDIQTIVYTYSASKLFETKKIDMVYYSILNENKETVSFSKNNKDKILKIISKLNN